MSDEILEWLKARFNSYVRAYSRITDEGMIQLGGIRIDTIEGLIELREKQLEEVDV